MNSYSLKAFTLIELIVVITIIGIISLGVYLPYSHHQKKALIHQGVNELSQSLTEARNLAVHGRASGSGNLHIGLLFQDETTLLYNGYPLTQTGALSNAEIIKTKKMPRGVVFTGGLVGVEYFFEAIDGSLIKREFLSDSTFSEIPLQDTELFELSYMGASQENLQGNVRYYIHSHISDF